MTVGPRSHSLVSQMIWNSPGDVIKILFCPSANIFTWYVRSLGFSDSFFMLFWLLDLWTSKYTYIFLREKGNAACLWLSGCCVCVCHSVSIHGFIETNVHMWLMHYSWISGWKEYYWRNWHGGDLKSKQEFLKVWIFEKVERWCHILVCAVDTPALITAQSVWC